MKKAFIVSSILLVLLSIPLERARAQAFSSTDVLTDNDGDGYCIRVNQSSIILSPIRQIVTGSDLASNLTNIIRLREEGIRPRSQPQFVPVAITPCANPSLPEDCNDGNADINPNKPAICDASDPQSNFDNNCDGVIDRNSMGVVCYSQEDIDGDGWTISGYANTSTECQNGTLSPEQCRQPDCDDSSNAVNPGKAEICGDANNLNEDCDPTNDKGPTWYIDTDKDGFGDLNGTYEEGCAVGEEGTSPFEGYVLIDNDKASDKYKPKDCNDSEAAINPDAEEDCRNQLDDNCNDLIDTEEDSCGAGNIDADEDGYTAADGGDCDDFNPNIHPGLIDMCDGIDNDCVSTNDEDLCNGASNIDDDGDGQSEDNGDCDDQDRSVKKGAAEICGDSIDNDCDTLYDEEVGKKVQDAIGCLALSEAPDFSRGVSTGGCSCDMQHSSHNTPSPFALILGFLLAPLTLIGGIRLIKILDPME